MPLYVKAPEVDRLAERLSTLRKVSKTEAVRQALTRELEWVEAEPMLVEKALPFVRELDAKYPKKARPPTRPSSITSMRTTDVGV